jgi:hypothetical protein
MGLGLSPCSGRKKKEVVGEDCWGRETKNLLKAEFQDPHTVTLCVCICYLCVYFIIISVCSVCLHAHVVS